MVWLVAEAAAGEAAAGESAGQVEPVAHDRDVAGAASLRQLERTTGYGPIRHLPDWAVIEPGVIEPGVGRLLEEAEKAFDSLESEAEPTWSGLMEPLERLHLRLDRVMGAIAHLLNVKYSNELNSAHDAVRPGYVELVNRIGQSRPIYDAMLELRDSESFTQLNRAQKRILTESIRDMERSGVHLDDDAKARYQHIQQRLAQLGDDFSANLIKQQQGSRIKVQDPRRVEGVPAPVLALAAETARQDGIEGADAERGPWHFVVDGPNYVAVIQHGRDRSLREATYRAYRARGTAAEFDNRPIVGEMLELRQELANLVGFPNYAELSIDQKMAPSVASVRELLDRLEAAARPAAEREYAELRQFMRDTGAAEADDPRPWDIAFFSQRLREARYGYDEESLRAYFQMPLVFDGLFSLVQRLYGFSIRRAPAGSVPVWDDSVWFFEVLSDDASAPTGITDENSAATSGGSVIAGFYVDPYARPGEKRGGAWMNTAVKRSRLLAADGASSSLPVALFVMNARRPAEGEPALMSLGEVRTLFHEFGHAMQHMFTDVEDGGASGLSLVEWDAAELASQFNEYWMDHAPFLRGLTAQVESGKPLDEQTVGRIVDSRNFMAGNAMLRQLQLARTDLTLHREFALPGVPVEATPFDIEARIAEAITVMPRLAEETTLPSFGHLFSGSYAAGYYSYKWAEVLAADAFAAFHEAGLDNDEAVRAVAERFRDTVLAMGGSRPAGEIYRLFRGRDATPEALLIQQGLLAAPEPAQAPQPTGAN